jgi:uncharacterized protein (DUF58 family)
MRRVRRLEIRTRRLVDESLAGSYHSVFRGRGMEFSGVRGYVRGDDVRTVDWNVTARTGHLHVKKFVEERELTVVVMVDASGSERFGTGTSTKMDLSAEISALLVFSAIRNNDRVGLLQFTDRVEQYLPPRKGREHGLRVLRELLTLQPAGTGTSISAALEYLRHVVTKRAVVFLLSDFQDQGYDRALRVAAQKHDVVALTVSDPRESTLPNAGLLAVRDPETGATGIIDSGSARVRQVYEEASRRNRELLLDTVRRTGVDLLQLSTVEDYERPLVRFFHERARRAMRGGG